VQPHRLLSLSGRVIEVEYRFCELSVPEFLRLARECGFDAVELRATQLPAETPRADAEQWRRVADELGLRVSCCSPPGITADSPGLQRLDQLSVQSVRLAQPDEPDAWEHAGRRYRRGLLDEPGALDYVAVFRGLRAIGFDGYITLNEPKPALMAMPAFVKRGHDALRAMLEPGG
jgi:sugar phosphate isomerase/epimerase